MADGGVVAHVYTSVCGGGALTRARECVAQEDWRTRRTRGEEGGERGWKFGRLVRLARICTPCSCVACTQRRGCIRSRCTDTRKRMRRRWSRRKRRMRLNAVGWQRRSAERMVSCRSVQLGVLCTSCLSVKIHRSVRREGRGTRRSLSGSERDGLVDIKHFFMRFRSRQRVSVRTRRNRRDTLATR